MTGIKKNIQHMSRLMAKHYKLIVTKVTSIKIYFVPLVEIFSQTAQLKDSDMENTVIPSAMNVISKPKESFTISRKRSVLLSYEDSIRWNQAISRVGQKNPNSKNSSSSKDINTLKDTIKDTTVANPPLKLSTRKRSRSSKGMDYDEHCDNDTDEDYIPW